MLHFRFKTSTQKQTSIDSLVGTFGKREILMFFRDWKKFEKKNFHLQVLFIETYGLMGF